MSIKITNNINDYMFYVEKDSKDYINKGYKVYATIYYDAKLVNNFPSVKNIKEIEWTGIDNNNYEVSEKIIKDYFAKIQKEAALNKKIVVYAVVRPDHTKNTKDTNDLLNNAIFFNKGKITKYIFN